MRERRHLNARSDIWKVVKVSICNLQNIKSCMRLRLFFHFFLVPLVNTVSVQNLEWPVVQSKSGRNLGKISTFMIEGPCGSSGETRLYLNQCLLTSLYLQNKYLSDPNGRHYHDDKEVPLCQSQITGIQ